MMSRSSLTVSTLAALLLASSPAAQPPKVPRETILIDDPLQGKTKGK